MRIKVLGVRGSIPTTGADTAFYGGNTSCVHVEMDNWHIVLDGGSGIQNVSINKDTVKRIDILLTHLHMDHIQGLGFFRPLFDPSMVIHIWGPASGKQTLKKRLSRYFSPPLFPVHIHELPCKLTLHEVRNSVFTIGPFIVHSRYVVHPGPTVGYRVTDRNSVFAYIPDHEPALGAKGMINERNWISGIDIAYQADLLLHDAQYSSEEYEIRKGWGHSSFADTGKFAAAAGVKHLLLSHHDPSHSDSELDQLLQSYLSTVEHPFKCELAREGTEFQLQGKVVSSL